MKCQDSLMRQIAPYSADVFDPFVLRRALPLRETVKATILSVTLLPLRIALMSACLLFAWLAASIGLRFSPEEERDCKKPLSGWRRNVARPFIGVMARLMFVFAGFHWIPTKGKRASPKEAPILALVPHSSFWDTVLVAALRCPCMVVRESTARVPFFGVIVQYLQAILVKRDDHSSRQSSIDDIVRRCRSDEDWDQIIIFPEGTVSNRQSLLEFKLGAFYPGMPIQPVFVKYPNRLESITWTWDGPGVLEQMWLSLSQFHVYCEIEFLPVYYPTGHERDNPRLYANNLRQYISKTCKIPTCHFSFDDVKYLNAAKEQNLPKTAALVKMLKLRNKSGKDLEIKTEQQMLDSKLETSQETLCGVQDFAKYLGVEMSSAVKDFFRIMDQKNSGKIDVRVYNVGLWLLRTDMSEWKRLEKCFKVFDEKRVITGLQFDAIALLWRGLPTKVSTEIFNIINYESKKKETISYDTFKSIATSYIYLEKTANKNKKLFYDDNNNNNYNGNARTQNIRSI